MLGARHALWRRTRLPYAYEIEYIEIATGGSFRIFTGNVLPSSGIFEFDVDAYVKGANAFNTFLGKYTSGGGGFILSSRSGKPDVWLTQSYPINVSCANDRHMFKLIGDDTEYWQLICDDDSRTINRGSRWNQGANTIALFNPSDRWNEQATAGDKFYRIKFIFDGVLVRDFIPVVDWSGVACLYDRVSKNLFYNQGSGQFVAGPRVYTTKDYIKNGLVAMWDGIENAGYGVHDSTATVWKDLIGRREFNIVSGSFSDEALVLNGSSDYAVLSQADSAATFNLIPQNGTMIAVFTVPDGLGANTLLKSNADVGINWNGACTLGIRNSNVYTGPAYFAQGSHTYAVAYYGAGNSYYLYRDGVKVTARGAYNDIGGFAPNGTTILGARSTSSSTFAMTRHTPASVYSIRLYNRVLTDEEIAHDAQIDISRFPALTN